MSAPADIAVVPARPKRLSALGRAIRNKGAVFGALILIVMTVIALAAPLLGTVDPVRIDPTCRNRAPGVDCVTRNAAGQRVTVTPLMGTDSLGRDVYSRVIYGARVSLMVGISVAVIAIAIGLVIGLVSGYFRWLDAVVMRVMDGLMAIPGILLAIGLVAAWRQGLWGGITLAVILAIVVPEIPRVVRLVRSVVLSIREEPYVEAAISVGTPTPLILIRHVLPNTIAPLIVQGTYICASAMLVEAILSFLGIGIPPQTPSWGNIMAEGRTLFRIAPHNILFPGIFLGLTVLAVNVLGDGLRDTLDPRMSKRV